MRTPGDERSGRATGAKERSGARPSMAAGGWVSGWAVRAHWVPCASPHVRLQRSPVELTRHVSPCRVPLPESSKRSSHLSPHRTPAPLSAHLSVHLKTLPPRVSYCSPHFSHHACEGWAMGAVSEHGVAGREGKGATSHFFLGSQPLSPIACAVCSPRPLSRTAGPLYTREKSSAPACPGARICPPPSPRSPLTCIAPT